MSDLTKMLNSFVNEPVDNQTAKLPHNMHQMTRNNKPRSLKAINEQLLVKIREKYD